MKQQERKRALSSSQIIIFGFLLVILVGTCLLMLPFSTKEWGGASFGEALFTATSATCVTGLVVQDTATYWSGFGQAVILLLIQIGGLGVVTVVLTLTRFAGGKIGLKQRSTMQEAISAPQIKGIVKMTGFILTGVFTIELIGAVLLATVFCREMGIAKGIWYSVFHSISAFCNAGFDLMGYKQNFGSLVDYAAHPMINIVIMLLIIIGGIGFFTWADIRDHGIHFRRYRMQSKVILVVSLILICVPAVYFFFFEYQEVKLAERIWSSIFQSVTTRTAGFNTTDLTAFSETGIMLMVILMLIGGSPGSTAGGMKTTTIALLFANAIAVFRRREDANFFKRRVSVQMVRNAATILLMYVTLCLAGAMIISRVEDIPLLTAIFETGSAVGTVGLTLGVTPTLTVVSRVILICLMFFGRVGGLTIIFATVSGKYANVTKYPEDKFTVG